MGIGGMARGIVSREGSQSGIADQKHIEIFREIFVASGGLAIAHVSRITDEQDMAHVLTLEEFLERRITLLVINDDVVRNDVDVTGNWNRQFPEAGMIV